MGMKVSATAGKRVIFLSLRIYAFTKVFHGFFPGFPVKSSCGFINFCIVQPNGAILSEVFLNDNSYDGQYL